MKKMEQEWTLFMNKVYGNHTMPKEVYTAMRRCFYAGFTVTMTVLRESSVKSEGEFGKVMEMLKDDFYEFHREITLAAEIEKNSKNV
jgi:hypothetical protein